MTTFYRNALRDSRVREYLPVTRLIWQENTSGAENLIGNMQLQATIGGLMKYTVLQPGGSLLVDFGIELHGGIRLITKNAGKVRIRFGESVSEAYNQPNQDHAIHDMICDLPKLGMAEYGNTAFRFVRIDNVADTELLLNNLSAVALFNDLKITGSFNSSDERLNRIWQTGAYTLMLNMQDYIYDGPKRDRLVWMGDMNPEIRTAFAVFEDYSLIRKSLDFVRELHPAPYWMNGISSYTLWFIISHLDYYRKTGDLQYLAEQHEYLRILKQMCLECIGGDGSEKMPDVRFLDWPSSEDPAVLHCGLHALLFWGMKALDELLSTLGEDTADIKTAIARLSTHVPSPGNSKVAAAMMTLSGLQDCSHIMEIEPFRGVSTFFGYYMLKCKQTVPALELVRKYWGAMLDFGATTFWEDFDLAWIENAGRIDEMPTPGKDDLHADFGKYCYKGLRHSLCHGWASGPTAFLSERILGVKFLEPGGRHISVEPDTGDLEYVSGSVPTIYGPVAVEAEKGGLVKVHAPNGIEVE
jgi:hypothetical protein